MFLIQILCQVHVLLIYFPHLCLLQGAIGGEKNKWTQTRDTEKDFFQEEVALEFRLERRVSG